MIITKPPYTPAHSRTSHKIWWVEISLVSLISLSVKVSGKKPMVLNKKSFSSRTCISAQCHWMLGEATNVCPSWSTIRIQRLTPTDALLPTFSLQSRTLTFRFSMHLARLPNETQSNAPAFQGRTYSDGSILINPLMYI